MPSNRSHPPRLLAAEALATVALVLPAAAFAAKPASDPVTDQAAPNLAKRADLDLAAGPRQPVLAPVSPLAPVRLAGEQRRAERQAAQRERRAKRQAERAAERREREAGPFNPVVGEVDYGSAEAAFGNARGRPHEGQDMLAPAGTPVISPTETVVVDSGTDGGRGNWIALYDANREQTYNYFHLIAPAKPTVGEKLDPGDRVGQVGCTGSCFGDHLHFEVRDGEGPYGQPRDPLGVIEGWERWRG